MMSQMKALEDENRRLKRMYADLSMQADRLKDALEKITRPSQRRELAEKVVAQRGLSIALACRTFGVSETCYRYSPQRNADNGKIADLLLGLVKVKKTWGFGLCFLHLHNVQGHRWKHKRVYRIYWELELNLRIKPRRRLKRENRKSGRRRVRRIWSGRWTSWRPPGRRSPIQALERVGRLQPRRPGH